MQQVAQGRAHEFWHTHGSRLVADHGPGSFKYELVVKMSRLHADILGVIDAATVDVVRGKLQDIVSLQSRHMIQFDCCLDDFNRYLTALRLLDVVLREKL
jgi:hypothetical protein